MKLPKAASNVNEVLFELKSLAEEAAEMDNPNGLFFALYALVTKQIKVGIDDKKFENAERMEAVDVTFGNILFGQVRAFREAQSSDSDHLSESWRFFFEAPQRNDLTAAQHMLLGVGPHILHDLAIAIFKVVPKEEIDSFHADYLHINHLLFQVLDQTQEILASKSCGMRLVDWLFCKTDELIAMGGLSLIRDRAFEGARRLHEATDPTSVEGIQKDLDAEALALSEAIAARATTCVLCPVGVPERPKFRHIINIFLRQNN